MYRASSCALHMDTIFKLTVISLENIISFLIIWEYVWKEHMHMHSKGGDWNSGNFYSEMEIACSILYAIEARAKLYPQQWLYQDTSPEIPKPVPVTIQQFIPRQTFHICFIFTYFIELISFVGMFLFSLLYKYQNYWFKEI